MIKSIYSTAVLAISVASIVGCRSDEEKRAEKLKADLKKPVVELYNDRTADLKDPSEQIYAKIGLAIRESYALSTRRITTMRTRT